MFNYLLFDLDNTLYNYEICYKNALEHVIDYIHKKYNLNKYDLYTRFEKIKKIFQNTIINNASSHNKCIQFKKLCEHFHLPLEEAIYLYNLFIDEFDKNLVLYETTEDFLQFCVSKNIKLYIVTNNLFYEQVCRLKKLNILKYFNKIYSSEEFGLEKPDTKLFYSILQENNINKNEVAMIGDSYKMDIESVNLIDIYAFHFDSNFEGDLLIGKENTHFQNYNHLLTFFQNYYKESELFIKLSTFCGERYDLVQAGGGNISFKINSLMFIKSSGCLLSDIEINKNYVCIDKDYINNNVKNITDENKKNREQEAKKYVDESIYFLKNYKPSIETTMHALTKKYTVHLHPLQFLKICAFENCQELLKTQFEDFCFINYFTPGIDVALELKKKYNNEEIIFLKNHGIVLTQNSIDELYNLLDKVMYLLEKIINVNLNTNLNYNEYKITNYISKLMNNITDTNTVSFLSNDYQIKNLFNSKINFKPYFPDKLVYCGISIVVLENIYEKDIEEIKIYISTNYEIPKIFLLNGYVYINSNSIKKCIEIESLLKSHLLCCNENNIVLSDTENFYLNNWDAETYRKKL
jgi:HAD superfamily hydrolase (TIGR01549 family)